MYLEPCRDIRTIDAAIWDSLIPDQNPFTSHAFLAALETSGSVGPDTGWDIFQLILYDDDKTIRAIMPAYPSVVRGVIAVPCANDRAMRHRPRQAWGMPQRATRGQPKLPQGQHSRRD